MARGLPDFGPSAVKVALGGMADIGELAARLGALPRYDRLGDVVFLEDFDADLGAWVTEISGAGAGVVVTPERRVTGSFSCKLTGGSTLLGYAGIRTYLPVPFSTVHGFEIAWTLHDDADYLYFRVDIYTGVYKISFAIKWDNTTLYNYYLNAAAGWTQILPQRIPFYNDRNFIDAKMTFDISTQKYSRMLVAPATFDIAGAGGLVALDATYPHMEISGRVYSKPTFNAYTYIDSIIVTANDI